MLHTYKLNMICYLSCSIVNRNSFWSSKKYKNVISIQISYIFFKTWFNTTKSILSFLKYSINKSNSSLVALYEFKATSLLVDTVNT